MLHFDVVRRVDAKKSGDSFYFTGNACSQGHVSQRYVANGHCVQCMTILAKTEKARKQQAKRRAENKTEAAEYHKNWMLKNRAKKLAYMRDYNKDVARPKRAIAYQSDPVLAVEIRCRARLNKAIARSGFSKQSSTSELIGCSWIELKSHIEKQFLRGMNWSNRSDWHIDHIVPLASAKTEEEIYKLFHFTNLRPMWAKDNRIKGCRREVLI